jgi:hypothetical protein
VYQLEDMRMKEKQKEKEILKYNKMIEFIDVLID